MTELDIGAMSDGELRSLVLVLALELERREERHAIEMRVQAQLAEQSSNPKE